MDVQELARCMLHSLQALPAGAQHMQHHVAVVAQKVGSKGRRRRRDRWADALCWWLRQSHRGARQGRRQQQQLQQHPRGRPDHQHCTVCAADRHATGMHVSMRGHPLVHWTSRAILHEQMAGMPVQDATHGHACAGRNAWACLCGTQRMGMPVQDATHGHACAGCIGWACLCRTHPVGMPVQDASGGHACAGRNRWAFLCRTQRVSMHACVVVHV
eukprot:352029-Chlamydomonas_euryale.AAC.2